jgi:hypothetical protein
MGGSFAENIIDVLYIVLALVVMQIQQLNYWISAQALQVP